MRLEGRIKQGERACLCVRKWVMPKEEKALGLEDRFAQRWKLLFEEPPMAWP